MPIRCLISVMLAACLLLTVSVEALAQPQITDALRRADRIAPGSPEERQVRQFCEHWVNQMLAYDDEGEDDGLVAVATARSRLVSVFEATLSTAFRRVYERILGGLLVSALDHEHMVVRLNSMVVASHFRTDAVVPLLETAAEDANPAVRYWSARTANLMVEAARDEVRVDPAILAEDLQHELLRILGPMVAAETSPWIFRQVTAALAPLSIHEADTVLLEGLIERLRLYQRRPDTPITGVYTALDRVSLKRFPRFDQVDETTRRLIVRTAFLYMRAYTTLSRADNGIDAEDEAWRRLATRANNVLFPWCEAMNAPRDRMPPIIRRTAARPAVLWQARFDWEDDILIPHLNFTSQDLALPDVR